MIAFVVLLAMPKHKNLDFACTLVRDGYRCLVEHLTLGATAQPPCKGVANSQACCHVSQKGLGGDGLAGTKQKHLLVQLKLAITHDCTPAT